jgi:hypothetical protein
LRRASEPIPLASTHVLAHAGLRAGEPAHTHPLLGADGGAPHGGEERERRKSTSDLPAHLTIGEGVGLQGLARRWQRPVASLENAREADARKLDLGSTRLPMPPAAVWDRFHFERQKHAGARAYSTYAERGSEEEMAQRIDERRELFTHELVGNALLRFWRVAKLAEEDEEARMPKALYVEVFARIAKALGVVAPRTGSAEQARSLAASEWASDMRGCDEAAGMDQATFCAALFELTDVWVEGARQ